MPEVNEGIVDRNAGRVRRSGSFLGFLALLLPGLVVAQCTVTINAGNTTPCLGDTLSLTTTSNTIHGPLVFNWTVTAGSGVLASSSNANTLFSPGSAGSVTVQVVATDTNGVTCTDTQVFNVTDASVAALTSTNVPPATQFGGLTTFSNCSQINSFNFIFQQQGTVFPGSGVTIDWGDGTADFTATGPWGTQNHTYVGAGLYLLTYTINDGGCTDTQQYNVFIGVNPGAQFGRPDNAPVCDEDSVYFLITPDATNVPGTTYTIYYGDGQSDVFQHPPPAQIGYAYGASSCNGAPYTVNCGGSSFPVAPAAGTFTACLCIENPCGGFPPTAPNIIVHQEAQASFPFPASACVNQTVTLNSSSVGGVNGAPCGTPYLTWSTQGPGTPSVISGTTGPFGTPQLQWQFPTPGIYDVELLAYGTAGVCEPDSITHPICIEPALVPQFNHSNPGTCVPQSISLTNTTNLTNNCSVTWQWLVTSSNLSCGSLGTTTWAVGNASSLSPTLSVTQPGTYTIVLRATNSCGAVDSAPYVFTVAAPPQVTINAALTTCE
ncbi:MAG: hypothetical protein JNM91_11575, partial [Flavobacteriales bacterium]|nr:hypothetical protein [Flavobacteriales bacterium]